MRKPLPAGHLVAVAALCVFVQLAAACSGSLAGPLAHRALAVSHQRAGPPGASVAGSPASPPGRPRLARLRSPPRADWAVPGSVIGNLDTAPGVLAVLHPGAIVIMHDGGGNRAQTVAALPAIIRGIRAAGYHIVSACAG